MNQRMHAFICAGAVFCFAGTSFCAGLMDDAGLFEEPEPEIGDLLPHQIDGGLAGPDGDVIDQNGHLRPGQPQQLVKPHAPSGGDMVDDDAVHDGVDIHFAASSRSDARSIFTVIVLRIVFAVAAFSAEGRPETKAETQPDR